MTILKSAFTLSLDQPSSEIIVEEQIMHLHWNKTLRSLGNPLTL